MVGHSIKSAKPTDSPIQCQRISPFTADVFSKSQFSKFCLLTAFSLFHQRQKPLLLNLKCLRPVKYSATFRRIQIGHFMVQKTALSSYKDRIQRAMFLVLRRPTYMWTSVELKYSTRQILTNYIRQGENTMVVWKIEVDLRAIDPHGVAMKHEDALQTRSEL